MKITLRDTQIRDLSSLPGFAALEELGFTEDSVRYHSSKSITIDGEFDESLLEIAKFLRLSKVRGTLTMAEDIEAYLKLRNRPDRFTQKVRTVEQFESFLTLAMKGLPRHWLYMYDEERGAWFCSYAYDIDYSPKRTSDGWTDPEHVTIDLGWLEFDKTSRSTQRFNYSDCVGLTIEEALHRVGLYLETEELFGEYQKSIGRFTSIRDGIGIQYLATGIGTDDIDSESSWWRTKKVILDRTGPSRVVVDVFSESDEEESRSRNKSIDTRWWSDDGEDEEVPIHPMIAVFDLKKHMRLRVHVSQITEYEYTTSLGEKLILPSEHRSLIDALLSYGGEFKDIVVGKGGGAVILSTGIPGTGKTLTAEVYAEVMSRPLYTVQCSQLGTNPDDLEESLHRIFNRAHRWKAILLLDEADVYVAERGSDLQQNAIVGVFLRVLEYYQGVLFLTTNRSDLIDDAIASRCIARLEYGAPTPEDAKQIWRVLSEVQGFELDPSLIDLLVIEFPDLTGRDIKNLLKLARLVVKESSPTIETFCLVKKFKPTK